ncbi:MAG: cell division protein FtsX [Patescibacteria group bacterium]|nr:MAG: cell division protein FtsX [Patescibacteria group bacterium]
MGIHFKTAIRNIIRSPFQAFAAVFVLAITFFIVSILVALLYSSSQVLHYFETRPQVIAFLKSDVSAGDIYNLQQKLSSDTRVKEVRYVSKEDALKIYKEATSETPLLAELVSPTAFPASLELSLVKLDYAQELISELKQEKLVDQVGFTANLGGEATLNNTINRLKSIVNYLRLGGGIFTAFLAVTSLMVLLVVISMRLMARKQEVDILNLIGATPLFVASPVILEAFIYVLVGVFIGWLLAFVLVLYFAPSLISYFGQIEILPKDTFTLFKMSLLVLFAEWLAGFVLAFLGSFLAISRLSKKKA